MTMPATGHPTPYEMHDGLAVYLIGSGEPILLMPGLHRFEQSGDPMADALIDGLRVLGRRVITFDPPGSGRSSRPARFSMSEMHECTDEALEVCKVSAFLAMRFLPRPVSRVGRAIVDGPVLC